MHRSIPRNLILGDGLLGSELVRQTGWDYISRRKDGFDFLDDNFYKKKLVEFHHGSIFSPKYDQIINCIAYTNSYSDDKKKHLDVNYYGVIKLVNFCNKWGIKLIHISTEYVYANNDILPTEEDKEKPLDTWYGKSKLMADYYIKNNSKYYLICRELHKPNPFPYPEVWDIKTSGDTVDKIAKLIINLINKDATGIFNVGTGSKNLKDLATQAKLINPPPYVPRDTRMNLTKLKKFLNEN